jgi:hypothetical protein
LVDPLGLRQVLEPVLAQIPESVARDELARRVRHENLPAVAGRGNAGRPMDVNPHIPLAGRDRLPGMQAHPDANRPLLERLTSS